MDPNTLPTPGLNVQQGPAEWQGVNPNVTGYEAPQPTERRNMEVPAAPAPAPPASAPPQMPLQPLPQAAPPVTAAVMPPTVATSTADLTADDSDLIEKEWVDKAKLIVMQTRTDPYMQNKEITKMKADYLKKRYNKDLKVSDE